MARPKGFEKPNGVKDYLPSVVDKLKSIEQEVLGCMTLWGYEQIITPTLEFYDTVGVASATSDNKLFKLLDRNGTQIVLRSDMTSPIARVASSLLKEQPFPLRLSYHANVFRAFDEEGGRGAEFYQTGVELIGDDSAEADAEVVALAISSLKAAGVDDFKIAIGHVGFLHALFHALFANKSVLQEELKQCLMYRDYVGYRERLQANTMSGEALNQLEQLLKLRGGREVCDIARDMSDSTDAQQALLHLDEVWSVLEAYGVLDYVMIDLTMIGDFSYYTGMTFEGYASELGFPVCSGGRYDNLLAQFGRPAPATGFALKTSRIIEILPTESKELRRVLILYDESRCKEALARAAALRSGEGFAVETQKFKTEAVELQTADESGIYRIGGKSYHQVIRLNK